MTKNILSYSTSIVPLVIVFTALFFVFGKQNNVVSNPQIIKQTVKGDDVTIIESDFPVGGIIMWSGSESDIPEGWVLCDGDTINSLIIPDLRGRFIVGYGSSGSNIEESVWSYEYANIGKGANGIKNNILTTSQLPSHSHDLSYEEHYHGGNSKSVVSDIKKEYVSFKSGTRGSRQTFYSVGSIYTTNINSNSGGGGHRHTADETGDSMPIENRPPFYVLAFIIKIK